MRLPFGNRFLFRFCRLFLISFFAFCLILIFKVTPCQGKEISVELIWKFHDAGWVQIQVKQGNYRFLEINQEAKSEVSFPKGSRLEMAWGGWTPVIRKNYEDYRIWKGSEIGLQAQSPDSTFQVLTPDGQKVSYRGSLTIRWEADHWKLINRVDSEEYLKGVVPIEMSNQWAGDGIEALKAQAVAARTYMIKKIGNTSQITDSPDRDQAYLGKNVEGAATQAVEETRGEILVDSVSHVPIDALYSSHNGGYSELAENVWGNPDPHFPSQPDPFSEGIGGAADRWRFIIGADTLGKTFGMGPVTQVQLDKLSSGRVKKVRLVDLSGKEKTVSGKDFVKAFYPFGQPIQAQAFLGSLFDARKIPGSESSFSWLWMDSFLTSQQEIKQATGPRLDKIISSSQGVREIPSPHGVYIFNGRGWGHGVGMSQWGAYHMAQLGYSYREILDFYYDRIQLVQANL